MLPFYWRDIIRAMKVSDLGEFGLVDLLARMVYASKNDGSASWHRLILGIGDDCAAWYGDGSVQLAHVDSLIQGVHFTLDTTPWKELGWKSLAVVLSDIAAMGGLATYALVSLTLIGDTAVEDVAALYEGMIDLAKRFDVAIIGGDTSYAPVVSITTTVLGSTGKRAKGSMLTRSAARPGDRIAVTGHPGSASAGFRMLSGNLQLDAESVAYLRDAFLRPLPRIVEGQLLVKHGVRAAIDISDGLVSDLSHVCKMSRVGARVEADRLPVHPAVRGNFGDKSTELALSGGEDYELLFTAGPEVMAKARDALTCPVTVIGEITADNAGAVTVVDREGNPFILHSTGWEHFKAR